MFHNSAVLPYFLFKKCSVGEHQRLFFKNIILNIISYKVTLFLTV